MLRERALVDREAHELDAEAAAAVLVEDVDVREVATVHARRESALRTRPARRRGTARPRAPRRRSSASCVARERPSAQYERRRGTRARRRGRSAPGRRRARTRRRAPASCGQRAQPEAAVELVRRGDHRERVPRARSPGRPRASASGLRRERRRSRASRRARAKTRPSGAHDAQTAPPARGEIADERRRSPPHSAQLAQVRQVAGEPEQLELERERERVERGRRGEPAWSSSSSVEEPRQRLERALVRAPARGRGAASPRRR